MTLQLILGPANARKAGRLLDAHQHASRAGRPAWFVVPTSADVERFQRELTGSGAPPGARPRTPTPFGAVMTGAGLEQRLLQRLGSGQRPLSGEQRRAVALAAISAERLIVLAPAARSGWLADELIALREELATTGDLGAGAEAGLRAWSRSAGDRDRRGHELAALLQADAVRLEQLASDPAIARIDRARLVGVIQDALRADPTALGDLHLALSGFDDLDPVQRALVVAVARSQATVVVSLPFQADREALTAAGGLINYLQAAGPTIDQLGPDTSGVTVAPLLARVEQQLYEQVVFDAAAPNGAAVAAGAEATTADTDAAAVLELRGGGPDEELALIAEYLQQALAGGAAPQRVAVVVSRPETHGPEIQAALQRAELPAHVVARPRARALPSVAALIGLLQAATDGGTARNLVDWLSGPGGPAGADALDAAVRRRGATTTREAYALWHARGGGELAELTALRQAGRRSAAPGAVERAAAGALRTRLTAALGPHTRRSVAAQRDARTIGQLLSTLDELAAFAELAPDLGLSVEDLCELIRETKAPVDREPNESIAIVGPLDVRTRHLEIVVVARAQRESYPATEPARRVLTRNDRATLRDHGWPAPARPDHAAAERYLAYEVVARPTARLALAWHDGDGDGKPCEPSPLLAEVRRAAGGAVALVTLPVGQAGRRGLAPERAARLDAARGGPRHREAAHEQSALVAAQERDRYAVGALQAASRCPAQWFVDHHLRPSDLSPDAAPLTAGRLRHELLAEVIEAVVLEAGQPLGPAALKALRVELGQASVRRAGKGNETQRERLMRERVVAEIDATLPALCGETPLEHQPSELELAFGTSATVAAAPGDDDQAAEQVRPPVVVERAGERLVLAGRIDRLDSSPQGTELVVVDYKGANVERYKQQDWEAKRELQAGLYALAAEQLAGGKAIASLYQPVPGPVDSPARGAIAAPLPGRGAFKKTDRLDQDGWDALLDTLVGLAGDAQRLIDDGIVAAAPARCSEGGCRYPWLCREVQA